MAEKSYFDAVKDVYLRELIDHDFVARAYPAVRVTLEEDERFLRSVYMVNNSYHGKVRATVKLTLRYCSSRISPSTDP